MSHEQILEWLPAYHDGELPPGRQKQVEAHLQDCVTCQAELEQLMSLSTLLQDDPLPQFTSPERFAAQVQLLLPRQGSTARRSPERLSTWLLIAPLLLMVVWAFLQAAVWVASFVLTTGAFFPGLSTWLGAGDLFETLITFSIINVALIAGATILWGTWAALWWAAKKHQNQLPLFN